MSKEFHDLLEFQGEIRMLLLKNKMDEKMSMDVSGHILHMLTESKVINESHKKAYNDL